MSEKTVVLGLLAIVAVIGAVGIVSEYLSLGGGAGLMGYNAYYGTVGGPMRVNAAVCKRAHACPAGDALYVNGIPQTQCPVHNNNLPYCAHMANGQTCSSFDPVDNPYCVFN